jgi:hypothetical protein
VAKAKKTLAHETKAQKAAAHKGYEAYEKHLKDRTPAEKHAAAKKAKLAAAKARHETAKQRRSLAKKRREAAAPAPAGTVAGGWLLAGNDQHGNCGPVAAANSLLALTGATAADTQIRALGTDPGPLSSLLGQLAWTGLAGYGLAACPELDPDEPLAGDLLLELLLPDGQIHAAALHDGAAITWGQQIRVPDSWLILRAWRPQWKK